MLTTVNQKINKHYTQTDLSSLLLKALKNAGKDIDALTRTDIATFDEFHIRGRAAANVD